jgi:glycosyltransferase involved in cell wall biosynthesis
VTVTPIRQVELSQPLSDISVPPDAQQCMLIFRWRGRVVGRSVVAVRNSVVGVGTVHRAAHSNAADAADACVADIIAHDVRDACGAELPTASVVVCTRERPDDLARALDALGVLHPAPLEVVVIDNAPVTEGTRDVVARYYFARYVREDRRGLNAARNRALREAHGEVVAFCDDDAVPEREWLAGLLPNFADPAVAVVTGLTLPLVLETEGQELFEQHCTFVRGFARRVFDGQHHNPFAVGPVGAGANMAVRKSIVQRLGNFDERLDGGMPTRSGGDHDLFVRVLLAGHRIIYDPRAVSWHRHRRSREDLLDTVYGYGVGVYAMWTGLLVERRELGVLRLAWQWFRHGQLRNLMQRHDPFLRTITWRELQGCMRGPQAWFAATRMRRGAA